jgi:hypothetical protein
MTKARPFPYPLFGGLAFGVCMGIFIGIYTGHGAYGFHAGFFSAFAFGLAIHHFTKTAESTTLLEMDGRAAGFPADEPVLHHSLANHFKGFEAVGGKLHLTRQRLRFRSHALNVQTHDESYPLESIARVEPARTLGIIPNAILVHLHDGRRERFVVMGRTRWVDAIRSVLPVAQADRS